MNIATIAGRLGRAILCLTLAMPAFAATTDLATAPLVTSSSTAVKPNVFLMMDDSGSMDWDYMPDNKNVPYFSTSTFGYASAQCNGVFYNPAITYTPPVNSDGTSFANSSFTSAWIDGFNVGNGTLDLSAKFKIGLYQDSGIPSSGAPAYYYKYFGTQTTAAQKNFNNSSSTFYTECNTTAGSAITTTIVVAGSGSTSVSGITVNGTAIMSGSATASSSTNTVASRIASNVTVAGYSASSSGSTVTITGPTSAAGYTPVVASSGAMTFTVTAFTPFVKVVVSSTSGLGGADERINFANWFSYYRTRIDMMKSGAGLAFKPLGTNYRVGFATMNNNSGSDLVNLATFDATQRSAWYGKLYGVTVGSSTPLLKALSRVGQMYANKLPSNKLNTVAATDPMQYACQQNFAILSTDGYWNDATNYDLSGNSVGNQDGTAARPFYDGGSTSNTLSDVAMYYYTTDLRNASLGNCTGSLGSDVCNDIVPTSGLDSASWQHMTLFTLGLGAPGRMVFSPTYLTDTSGDYFDVRKGTLANPPSICSWGVSGHACNWPTPNVSGTPENIDDLWHAAVNGRGAYFNATDPNALATGLSNALAGVSARAGASAAATTSNPNVTSGDNFVFSSTFDTVYWYGELTRQQLDLTTGVLSTTIDWSAAAQLDTLPLATRKIYVNSTTTPNVLTPFVWANLSAAQQAYFNTSNISTLSQFCSSGVTCLSAANQTAAAGSALLNFIRGDRTNEGPLTDNTTYYRQRTHILGDIVDAEAVYVKGSLFNYADAGYSSFASGNSTRQGAVYAAANDGMLHAFDAGTGAELWAYVPTAVIPNLYKLADKNYANLHQYFVDGTPVTGDAYFGGVWHTILVGGLNNGGRSYYALDVTNPIAPVLLWEFTDTNLGYSYGNPVVTKLSDGTWVVLLASGYNNASPGDGQGRVYVLNAGTGSLIRSVNTAVGSTTTPSGLARISAWVDNPMVDNTAKRVYGGDLLGNVWRLDVNAGTVQLLATLNDSSGNAQSITVKPELGTVSGNAVVFVGTGRYLGVSDLSNTSQQTFYAIKDTLGSTTYTNPRLFGHFVQQIEVTGTCPSGEPATICLAGQIVRTSTSNIVNFATDNGWYIDLPDTGERDNTDPTLGLGTLAFTTNVPNVSACTAGGYSYRYFLDYRNGAPVSTAGTVVAVKLGNALGTRPVLVRLPNNTIIELTRLSDGTTVSSNVPIGNAATATRRVGWHELNN